MAFVLDEKTVQALIAFVPPQYQGIAALGLPILMQLFSGLGVVSTPTPTPTSTEVTPTPTEIQIGVLKRIADALEKIAAKE